MRKRTKRTALNLSIQSAAHALSILVSEGKVAVRDVTSALRRREKVVSQLRAQLAALETGLVDAGKAITARVSKGPRKARKRVSKAARAAWQAQGRYLGAVRRLSVPDRAKIKGIRAKSGVRAATAAAKRMAKR
jgi:hypothetical protein